MKNTNKKSEYQIIIPMSGFGERFRRKNYKLPKPLIDVLGKSIIQYVCEMFPGEENFIFICNEDHLSNPQYKMRNTLEQIAPKASIVGIASHKLGPIHAVLSARDYIHPEKKTIINYCDFTCDWNWIDFKKHVETTKCVGSIPAYKGFHPHSLGTTQYAYLKEIGGLVCDIKEKEPFTQNRMQEYASSGTYYFDTGLTMFESLEYAVQNSLHINNEYYVSLAYKYLFSEQKPVTVYPLKHFMQWGTPEDLEDYINWANIFSSLCKTEQEENIVNGSVVVPMAGLGKRFKEEGYKETKPLLPVSGEPMIKQALSFLPKAKEYSFVVRGDMPNVEKLSNELSQKYDNSTVTKIPTLTEGQAVTAKFGVEALNNQNSLLTIGVCDCGVIYDQQEFNKLAKDQSIDVIVWTVRGHPHACRNPNMYGWVREQNNIVTGISVKTPLESPETDPVVTGIFSFKSHDIFQKSYDSLMKRNYKVNGEYYLDSCIQDALDLGYNCAMLEVQHYISWGTPNDYKTFHYWQECFDGWAGHGYRYEKDWRFSKKKNFKS